MKYICLGYVDPKKFPSVPEAEMHAMMDSGCAYDDQLRANGHFQGGHALQPPDTAMTLRYANGRVVVTDGPFTETKEQLGGILILEAEGGETATEAYDFQAFMGSISLAAQVWADGRENLVHNVNFVGTPLSALRTVLAAGDTPRCDNAFCGAESGAVPVSTTCPAVLLSNLELQAGDQRKFTPFILPIPFEEEARERARRGRRRR